MKKISRYDYFKKIYSPEHKNIQSKDMSDAQWKDFDIQLSAYRKQHEFKHDRKHPNKDSKKQSKDAKSKHKKKKDKGKSKSKFKSKSKEEPLSKSEAKFKARQKAIRSWQNAKSSRKSTLRKMRGNKNMKYAAGMKNLKKETPLEKMADPRGMAYASQKIESKLSGSNHNNALTTVLGLAFAMMAEDDKKLVRSRILNAVSPIGIKQALKRTKTNHRVHKLAKENKAIIRAKRGKDKNKDTNKPHNNFYVPNHRRINKQQDDELDM